MRKNTKILLIITFIMCLFFLVSCDKEKNNNQHLLVKQKTLDESGVKTNMESTNEITSNFKQGRYITNDGMLQIEFYVNKEFLFDISFLSRKISGQYILSNSKLSLFDGVYELVFLIGENKIIFKEVLNNGEKDIWIIQPEIEFFYQEYHEINTEKIVDSSEFCYYATRNSRGSPIVLNYDNTEAIFECYVTNGFFYLQDSTPVKKVIVAPGDGFWWIPSEDSDNPEEKIYVDVILRLDDKIIGYAVIEIYSQAKIRSNFSAKTIKAALFPKINGEYQNITVSLVESIMRKIKEEQ